MAFPEGWPPRPATGVRSIRFYTSGTTTAGFLDNAFLFIDGAGANPFTPTPVRAPGDKTPVAVGSIGGGGVGTAIGGGGTPMGTGVSSGVQAPGGPGQSVPAIWCSNMRIINDGTGDLEISFDGTNVHGVVKPSEALEWDDRYECGVALRGAGGEDFRVEAW